MSIAWLVEYAKWRETAPRGVKVRDRFLCPCCFMPTLTRRGSYEICAICFWEDDGQDNEDADVYLGGPNHGLTLTEARHNFDRFRTMYPPEHALYAEQKVTETLRLSLYTVMSEALTKNSKQSWQDMLAVEKQFNRKMATYRRKGTL